MAPEVGLEPTTHRLTADCSTIELLWNPKRTRNLQIDPPPVKFICEKYTCLIPSRNQRGGNFIYFSRPLGTWLAVTLDPAVNCRAIFNGSFGTKHLQSRCPKIQMRPSAFCFLTAFSSASAGCLPRAHLKI